MFDLSDCSYSNMDAAVMKNILGILSTHYVERCVGAFCVCAGVRGGREGG